MFFLKLIISLTLFLKSLPIYSEINDNNTLKDIHNLSLHYLNCLSPTSKLLEVIENEREFLLINDIPSRNLPITTELFNFIKQKNLKLSDKKRFLIDVFQLIKRILPENYYKDFTKLSHIKKYPGIKQNINIISRALEIVELHFQHTDIGEYINIDMLKNRIILAILFKDIHLLLNQEINASFAFVWFDIIIQKAFQISNILNSVKGNENIICEIIDEINNKKIEEWKHIESKIIKDAILLSKSKDFSPSKKLLTIGGKKLNKIMFPIKPINKTETITPIVTIDLVNIDFEKDFFQNEDFLNNGMIFTEVEKNVFLQILSQISTNVSNKELLNEKLVHSFKFLEILVKELGITSSEILIYAFIQFSYKQLSYDINILKNIKNSDIDNILSILINRNFNINKENDYDFFVNIFKSQDLKNIKYNTLVIIDGIIEKIFELRTIHQLDEETKTAVYFSTISKFISQFIDIIDATKLAGSYSLLLQDAVSMLYEQVLLTGKDINFLNFNYMIKYHRLSDNALLAFNNDNFQIKINEILKKVNSKNGKKHRLKKHIKWFDRRIKFLLPERYIRRTHLRLIPFINNLDKLYPELKDKISIQGNLKIFNINDYIKSLHYFCSILLKTPIKDWKEFENYFVEFQYLTNKTENDDIGIFGYSFAGNDKNEIVEILKSIFQKKEPKDPIAFAAEKFVQIVKLQAFHNGNHRTADFVLNFILLKNGLPFFCITPENIGEYYKLLNTDSLRRNNFDMKTIVNFFKREIEKNSWMHLITTSYSLNTKLFANKYQALKSILLSDKFDEYNIKELENKVSLTKEEIYRSFRYFEPIIGEFVNIIDDNGMITDIIKKYKKVKEDGNKYAKVNIVFFNQKGELLKFNEKSLDSNLKNKHLIYDHLLLGEDHFEAAVRKSLDELGIYLRRENLTEINLSKETTKTEKLFVYRLSDNEENLINQNQNILSPIKFVDFHKEKNDLSLTSQDFDEQSQKLLNDQEICNNILTEMQLPLSKSIEYTLEELIEKYPPVLQTEKFLIYSFGEEISKSSLDMLKTEYEDFVNKFYSPLSPYNLKQFNFIITRNKVTGLKENNSIYINIQDIADKNILKNIFISKIYTNKEIRKISRNFYKKLNDKIFSTLSIYDEDKILTLISELYSMFFYKIIYEIEETDKTDTDFKNIFYELLNEIEQKLINTDYEPIIKIFNNTINENRIWDIFISEINFLKDISTFNQLNIFIENEIEKAVKIISNDKRYNLKNEINEAFDIINTPYIAKPFNEKRKKVFHIMFSSLAHKNKSIFELISSMFSFKLKNKFSVSILSDIRFANLCILMKKDNKEPFINNKYIEYNSENFIEMMISIIVTKKILPIILLSLDDKTQTSELEKNPLAKMFRASPLETFNILMSKINSFKKETKLIEHLDHLKSA